MPTSHGIYVFFTSNLKFNLNPGSTHLNLLNMETQSQPELKSQNGRGPNWTTQEEEELAKSYVHISTQAEVGTGQSAEDFFIKISDHFNSKIPNMDRHRNSKQIQTW